MNIPLERLPDCTVQFEVKKEGHLFKGKKIVLTNDIDLSKIQWEPIGSNKDGEAIGDFDGQGHTVTIDMANVYHKEFYFGGLFGYIANDTE